MTETVADLTAFIQMLQGDIQMFGPAGNDLQRLNDAKQRRAALIRQAQENCTREPDTGKVAFPDKADIKKEVGA